MNSTLEFLKGKKTYFVAFAAAIYGAGIQTGLWQHYAGVDLLLGSLGITTLRAGIAKVGASLVAFGVPPLGGLLLAGSILLTGCAHFSTRQTDLAYSPDGKPTKATTTKAVAWTFFSAKSELAKFRASQTEKTQTASVGALTQEGGQTNQVSDIIAAVVSAAVNAAKKP